MPRSPGTAYDEPTLSTGGTLRKGRELEPDWARGLSPDEVLDEGHARRLPLETDPDTISDPEVRSRFVRRLQNVDDGTPYPDDELPSRRSRAGASVAGARDRYSESWLGGPVFGPGDGGGLVLGAFAWPIILAALREGPYGVKRWLSAKFVNKVLPPAAGGGGGAAAHPTATPTATNA